MKFTIGRQLGGGFALLVFFSVVLGIWSVMKIHGIFQSTTDLYLHPLVVSNAVRDIRANIFAMETAMKEAAIADNDHQIQAVSEKISRLEQEVLGSLEVVAQQFLGDKARVDALQKRFIGWRGYRDKMLAAALKGDHQLAGHIDTTSEAEYLDIMKADIRYLINFANEKAKTFYQNAEDAQTQAANTTYLILAVITITGGAVSYLVIKNITSPLAVLVMNIRKIATGNLEETIGVKRNDEIGEVANSLRDLTATMRDTARQANRIAAGDYSADIVPLSDYDELGTAMRTMIRRLQELSQENRQKDWLNNGQVALNDQVRGELSLEDLASRIINSLAKYLDAQIGALYINTDQVLHLRASYAYSSRKKLSNSYSFGEGLVGQAALERNHILISPCPEDYFRIESGLGGALPASVLVYPLMLNNEVKGVVELGAFRMFSEAELSLLHRVQESLAIALNSVESRARQTDLLNQTLQQAEELQAQEEELKQTNEELEQQAEELRLTNEQLEEKSEVLERQAADLRQAKSEIEEKAMAVELASKYKSEFLANMSHELRSPLNSLLILSKSLAENEEGNLNEEQTEAARIIHGSGNDLLALINDILDLSKAEAGRLEIDTREVRFPSLVHDLKNQFKALAEEKGLQFTIKLDPELPEAMITDEQRLKQILKNLLANGIKFTSEGSVTLTIKQVAASLKGAGQTAADGDVISFAVSDTGIGIPLEKHKAIFEAFQQADGSTSRRFGGTGLGLTISRRLAYLLGGEIAITSAEGKGTTFTLFLPSILSRQDSPLTPDNQGGVLAFEPGTSYTPSLQEETFSGATHPPAFVPDDREEVEEGDKTVLIIEDDGEFAKILVKMARDKGYKALVAGDGRSGMFMAHAYLPKAVILDLGLPDVAGVTVLDNLKGHLSTRHIPVHVISAHRPTLEIRQKGAFGYLNKPVSAEELSQVFSQFDTFFVRGGKKLLVVEDDPVSRRQITKLLSHPGVEIAAATTGQEAKVLLTSQTFDCVILDLTLPDMTGFELLRELEQTDHLNPKIPVIIYTGRDMTSEENDLLQQYARTVVIKGAESQDRLADEVSLFLHSVTSALPPEQQKIIRMIHDKDEVLRGKKILLVDDDMRNVFALSGLMGKIGMQVIMAANGEQALEKLQTDNDVDLVLMDIMMPVMDGYETMRRIRAQAGFRKLPIIALTAKAMPEDRVLCMDAGASDYITKPVDRDKLFSLMRVWLFK
jgi:CheY-like chemotaxis protein/HAMP domain-containing protein